MALDQTDPNAASASSSQLLLQRVATTIQVRPGDASMSDAQRLSRAGRVALGHKRLFASIVVGVSAYLLLPSDWMMAARAIIAWDIGVIGFLLICSGWFATSPQARMAADSEAQEEGEWTIFFLFIAATVVSFATIVDVFAAAKDLTGAAKGFVVALVALTLFLSWLVTHVLFALRYAHEYYDMNSRWEGRRRIGFPGRHSAGLLGLRLFRAGARHDVPGL